MKTGFHHNPPRCTPADSMMRVALCGWMATFALLLAGCSFITGPTVTGSGNLVTKQYPLTDFTRISAGNVFDVTVKPGSPASVSVTVDDNLVEYLDVTTSGDQLRLHLKSNTNVRNATLKAVVTVPELTAFELSGASKGRLDACRSTKPLDIEVSGASHLEGDVESGDMRLEVSGASHAQLKGSGGNLHVNASGASHADLREFQVKDVNVDASGASHATIHPSGKLIASASGASTVHYAGQPANVDSHTSGASSVKAD
jgi:hypothetical protein